MWLCAGKLKVKTAHFWLPSASQKRACLSYLFNCQINTQAAKNKQNKKKAECKATKYCWSRSLYLLSINGQQQVSFAHGAKFSMVAQSLSKVDKIATFAPRCYRRKLGLTTYVQETSKIFRVLYDRPNVIKTRTSREKK